MGLHKGSFVFVLVDAVLSLIVAIAILAAFLPLFPPFAAGSAPFFIIFVMDVLCAIGIWNKVTCLIVFWQIFMILHIIYLFIVWLCVAVVVGIGMTAVAGVCGYYSYTDSIQDTCNGLMAGLGFLCFLFLVWPIVDIYLWIVVNSAREEMSGVNPMGNGAVMHPQQPLMVASTDVAVIGMQQQQPVMYPGQLQQQQQQMHPGQLQQQQQMYPGQALQMPPATPMYNVPPTPMIQQQALQVQQLPQTPMVHQPPQLEHPNTVNENLE